MSKYDPEKAREYYLKNKERLLANNKKWQAENREKMREYSKKYKSADNPTYVAYAERTWERGLWTKAKHSATKMGREFSIGVSDIVIPSLCPYLGIELTTKYGAGKLESTASLDRIDSSKGYVKGNIQVISWRANRMKQDASLDELLEFAHSILEMHKAAQNE